MLTLIEPCRCCSTGFISSPTNLHSTQHDTARSTPQQNNGHALLKTAHGVVKCVMTCALLQGTIKGGSPHSMQLLCCYKHVIDNHTLHVRLNAASPKGAAQQQSNSAAFLTLHVHRPTLSPPPSPALPPPRSALAAPRQTPAASCLLHPGGGAAPAHKPANPVAAT